MPEVENPFITPEVQADGSLLIKAGGEWSMHQTLPAQDEVAARLNASPVVRSVRFDFSQLGDWDSTLVSIVAGVVKQCREKEIPLQTTGLPEGVKQLAKMALAVPEQNARRAPDRELFFT